MVVCASSFFVNGLPPYALVRWIVSVFFDDVTSVLIFSFAYALTFLSYHVALILVLHLSDRH